MNEPERIRELLGIALEGEPPNETGTDELVRLGRRRVRMRRAIGAAGVMAVAVVLLVSAALLRPLLGNHVQPATSPPATTAAPDTDGVGPDGVTDQQLNQAVTTMLADDGVAHMRVVNGATTFSSRGTTATLNATLADSKGTGTLSVNRMATTLRVDQLCPAATACTFAHHLGLIVAIYTRVVIAPYGVETVAVAQKGNVRAIAASANFTPNAATWSRPSPPITDNQLALMAAQLAYPVNR